MTTKTKPAKVQLVGPTITKQQRAEALEFYAQLSAPKTSIDDISKLISSTQLSSEDVNKLIAQLRTLKTTSHKSGPTTGVGKRCRELIVEGLSNKEVLAKIKEEFPSNNTTYSCVAWYRNDMKK